MSLKRLKFNFRNQTALDTISLCERTAQNLAALPPEHLEQVSHADLAATVAAVRASHDHIATLRGQLREEITRRNTLLKTVRNQTMPLGNKTGMTDDERAKLGAWIVGLK